MQSRWTVIGRRLPWRILLISLLLSSFASAQPGDPPIRFPDRFPDLPASKTTIGYPSEPFAVADEGRLSWIKFSIRVDEPDVVHFQSGARFPLHYDFVSQELPPYIGIEPAAFDALSFYQVRQELVLGTVLFLLPAGTTQGATLPEVGIQLIRSDPYSVSEVAQYFETARAAIRAGRDGAGQSPIATYVPAFEQQESALASADSLLALGISVRDVGSWLGGGATSSYVAGWGLGRLVEVRAGEIGDAYQVGILTPYDILLTNGVPAEIPFVAGVLTLSPTTPNSHVTILGRDWKIPFAFLDSPDKIEAAQSLIGERVLLRVPHPEFEANFRRSGPFGLWSTLHFDAALIRELEVFKHQGPLDIVPMETFGSYSESVDKLSPADLRYFGGKASGYGLIRDAIPHSSRFAIALSFDLWNDFLDQPLTSSSSSFDSSLRGEIARRLAPFSAYPPDIATLTEALREIRDLIKDETVSVFSAAQMESIENALLPFDAMRKIRFRSSSNAEDGEHFTGAGLYDSFSGCLADDLDDDDEGPSLCDASKSKERGVFRAIRKVYASFYNDNAYLERLRRGIDEAGVGMAILIHHSFPDETELANGVATMTRTNSQRIGTFVTQPGAASVANPSDAVLPEIAVVQRYSFGTPPHDTFIRVLQRSQLLPAGQNAMTAPEDYRELHVLLSDIADAYEDHHNHEHHALDFEYKKIADEGLVVKQVRPLPANQPETVFPRLVQGKAKRCGQSGLRTRFCVSLETERFRLDPAQLADDFYAALEIDYIIGERRGTLATPIAGLPGARHEVEKDLFGRSHIVDRFRIEELGAELVLRTTLPAPAAANAPEVIATLEELKTVVSLAYDEPRLVFRQPDSLQMGELQRGQEGGFSFPFITTLRSTDYIQLGESGECQHLPDIEDEGVYRRQLYRGDDGLEIELFYRIVPRPPGIISIIDLRIEIAEATIRGLTTDPLVLRGRWGVRPQVQHHGPWYGSVFTPLLDPCVPEHQKSELRASGHEIIYAFQPSITWFGGARAGPWDDALTWVFHPDATWSELPMEFVPEPSAALCAATALLTLAGLRASRRSGTLAQPDRSRRRTPSP